MNRTEATTYAQNNGEVLLFNKTFPEWEQGLATLPDHMQPAVARWVLFGVYPGHFLSAIIENDLFRAVSRADNTNVKLLPLYCGFFYNYAPGDCFGKPEWVKAWFEKGGWYAIETP